MQGLIDAINQSHSKDIIDIIAIFSPLVLSVVAIVISLYTVHKQNKIALFKIRYKALSQLKSILCFDAGVYDCDDEKMILLLFDSYFNAQASILNVDGSVLVSVKSKVEDVKYDILTSIFVFDKKYHNEISDILKDFHEFVTSVSIYNINKEAQKNLHEKCVDFYENDFKKISKETKI